MISDLPNYENFIKWKRWFVNLPKYIKYPILLIVILSVLFWHHKYLFILLSKFIKLLNYKLYIEIWLLIIIILAALLTCIVIFNYHYYGKFKSNNSDAKLNEIEEKILLILADHGTNVNLLDLADKFKVHKQKIQYFIEQLEKKDFLRTTFHVGTCNLIEKGREYLVKNRLIK